MNDWETIAECLPQINPALLEYDEWLQVGCAIKNSGGSLETWDHWSRQDQRYKENECARKWNGFRGSTTPVGVGTIVKLCRDQGGDISGYGVAGGADRPLDWDCTIPAESDLRVVRPEWLQEAQLPPMPEDWSGLRDFSTYLKTLFSADEIVGYVVDTYQDESGTHIPKKGAFTRTAGELLELAGLASSLADVIGDWPEECGGWIRFNPLDGKGVADSNVTSCRYALVESDSISIEKQYAIYKELELPIAALVHSGKKSLHAIVKIDAPDFKEYQKRVDFLYDVCKKNGLVIDRKNRNPSRLSRMPGVTRSGVSQRLIETNSGKATWQEWSEWIAALNDDLPDFEALSDFISDPPPVAECLIEGILRMGHKMLVSGPSKAGKSFLLLGLCAAIAEGRKWLGWQCRQGRVLYVNLELDRASCYQRIKDVYTSMRIPPLHAGNIDLWHLRGKAMGMDNLAPRLIRRALKRNYSAIIIDPIYKVITGDENAADQMAKFCNQFDRVCHELNAAVIYCHHHSKGDQGQKRAQDRASGSGVFARDPDALIDMLELEIDDSRREQIVNQWSCDALYDLLDAQTPGWRMDIGQDEALVAKKLAAFAVEKVGQGNAYAVVKAAEVSAEHATGWCVGGILREFAGFKPRYMFFCYPIHKLDSWGLLEDAHPQGDPPLRRDRKEAIAEAREIKDAETRLAVCDLFQKQKVVEVKELAEALNLSEKVARERLKSAGIQYRKGDVINPNATNDTPSIVRS